MSKRNLIIGIGVIALAIAWYAFRPGIALRQQNGQRGAACRSTGIDGNGKRDRAHGSGEG